MGSGGSEDENCGRDSCSGGAWSQWGYGGPAHLSLRALGSDLPVGVAEALSSFHCNGRHPLPSPASSPSFYRA